MKLALLGVVACWPCSPRRPATVASSEPARAGGAAATGPRAPGPVHPRRPVALPRATQRDPRLDSRRAAQRGSGSREPHRDRARERHATRAGDPFLNPYGHQPLRGHAGPRRACGPGSAWAATRAAAAALVRGVVVDVGDARRTVDGAAIAVWGTGRNTRILDTTVRGHGTLSAGVEARRPEGLVIERLVARRFRDFGVLVDANEPGAPRVAPAASGSPTSTSRASAGPSPGSSMGTRGGVRVDRRNRARCAGCARARAHGRACGRGPRPTAPGSTQHRRRPRPHRRLRRALHPRQRLPPAADRAQRPRRPDRRVGRPGMGPAAGQRRQRDRGQPLRELARRRLPRRGDHAARPCAAARSASRLGRRSATTSVAATASTPTTSAGSAPSAQAVRHDHLSSIREG